MQKRAARATDRTQELETIRSLCETGFQVIIFGAHDHLAFSEEAGFTQASAVVILDRKAEVEIHRRKIALMASRAAEDEAFAGFVSSFVAENMANIYELRVINGHHRDAFGLESAVEIKRKGNSGA